MTLTFEQKLYDERSRRVLGFLVAKGLLINPLYDRMPSAKFSLDELMWVAKNVEPRVIEVLPAVILHFRSVWSKKPLLPDNLRVIVAAIKEGRSSGPDFGFIKYKDMFRWANLQLNDKRTKPSRMLKKLKTFKLSKEAINSLSKISKRNNESETDTIERLILNYNFCV